MSTSPVPCLHTGLSLSDLLEIRRYHLDRLRECRGYLGSAIGLKFSESQGCFKRDAAGRLQPVVTLFVKEKLNGSGSDALPGTLSLPDGRSCMTDVVTGSLPAGALKAENAKTPELQALLCRLQQDRRIGGGMPISNAQVRGTVACVVRRKGDTTNYLLTNRHIAGFAKDTIEQRTPEFRQLGLTRETLLTPKKAPRGCFFGSSPAAYHLDAALIALSPRSGQAVEGVHLLEALGEPLAPDLSSLEPLGRRVMGVGSSMGLRKGVIMACAYEWDPNPDDEVAYSLCDYLIMGAEDGQWPDEVAPSGVAKSGNGRAVKAKAAKGRPFAVPGDSGMLVVTMDAAPRPLALLWGGQKQTFWSANAQEGWAYATSIIAVMDALKIHALKPV